MILNWFCSYNNPIRIIILVFIFASTFVHTWNVRDAHNTHYNHPSRHYSLPLETENEILDSSQNHRISSNSSSKNDNEQALFPQPFNVAFGAYVTANATCGERKPTYYCQLSSGSNIHDDIQCSICDAYSKDSSKQHPIESIVDGKSETIWQGPTLESGPQAEWVSIKIDLGQMYEVRQVTLSPGISLLPANFILERSIDGVYFSPWQYFAASDTECWERYRVRPTIGKIRFRSDDEVICTSLYSKQSSNFDQDLTISLIDGRPGFEENRNSQDLSWTLREFIKAQYIQIHMQKFKPINSVYEVDRKDKSLIRRFFYSLRHVKVDGVCVCNGHSSACGLSSESNMAITHASSSRIDYNRGRNTPSKINKCACAHNTCGRSCEKCCPLFNQQKWKPGSKSSGAGVCEECQCFGHADSCFFDQSVADKKLSLNKTGHYDGGGVCERCQHHTTGINCEQCEDGYYRPAGITPYAKKPCVSCQCSGPGMTRLCVKDDNRQIEGLKAGDCLCKEGFEGSRCDRCAKGYRNYPRCEPCTCVHAGIVNTEVCDGNCQCKMNVQGSRCDRCKEGFYNLVANNPEGCSSCYCFGATDRCKSSDYGIEIIRSPVGWSVTDVPRSFKINPIPDKNKQIIANDEVPSTSRELYYWEAPEDYLGQNLYTYGNNLKYVINYVVVRGDTSGVFTDDPDVIVEGGPDKILMGYRWHKSPVIENGEDDLNSTIIMPLREQGWFRVDEDGRSTDIPITREEFTLALYDLKRLLVRAKFHTDQVEGGLNQLDIEKASNSSKSVKKAIGTEQCDCPEGYGGLSCEYCLPGYRRVNNMLINGICEKCDCNNHALSCDAYTGACSECLHNTTGINCGECKPGFYGDATRGQHDDCKPCACPLQISSNNFSPTCRAESNAKYGYICLECPEGYTGERCEICANGYYGNPLIPGGFCTPCDCGPNANTTIEGYCDHLTGQCRYCLGNTSGWKCNECLPDHWGNAEYGDCRACECNHRGSLNSQCDPKTGQCQCKPNFTGPKCDRCAPEFGNIELDCPPCECNQLGSIDNICDPESGQCHCKAGVTGQHCDRCLEGNYGFSSNGCEWCNCNKLGSEGSDCNEVNGQCVCKPFVTGRDCGHCQPGYWNIASGKGCEPCNCNATGSLSDVCDEFTGKCQCKPGVGGIYCDQCLPGYYDFSSSGCKRCDPCDAPGHICDPKSGKCVCPPNTAGPTCNDCAPGTWGYDILSGCSPCNCNLQGSLSNECNHKTGECICLEGFEGIHCDKCKFGYYRFPNCRKCDCHEPGTLLGACRSDGLCQCDENGQCPCKVNVAGRRCDQCKEGTFALSQDNPLGCFGCFCFGKTERCEQSSMLWTEKNYGQREINFIIGNTEIKSILGFRIIPQGISSVGVQSFGLLQQPFYWTLPIEMLNDQVNSYNGFLRFRIYSRGGSKMPDSMLRRFPLVVLQGNHRLILYHFGPKQPSTTGMYHIRFHETEWTLADNPEYPVTRDVLMVALQKVQNILVRATDQSESNYVRLSDLSLEVAINGGYSSRSAIGVEECRCPSQYTSPSCQDPNIGYCRKRKPNFLDSKDILDLVGWSEACQCNGYSKICDRETCECQNCEAATTGPQCNVCLKGYYGDPTRQIPCRKCACPTIHNSFSETCELVQGSNSEYICTACQDGYTGRHCEQCADGYWGNPLAPNGQCIPCQCSPIGSISNICNKQTGECLCKSGITGYDCSNCPPRHIFTETGCLNCDNECTGLLLDDIDFLQSLVHEANLTDVENLPWTRLMYLTKGLNQTIRNMDLFKKKLAHAKDVVGNFMINFDLETLADLLMLRSLELARKAPFEAVRALETQNRAQNVRDLINDLWEIIQNIVNKLKRHGFDVNDPFGSAADRMFEEAKLIFKELKLRDFSPNQIAGDQELRKAQELLDRVQKMLTERGNTGPLRDRLTKLFKLLSEVFENIERKIFPETRETMQKLGTMRPILKLIVNLIDNANRDSDETNSTLTDAKELLERIRQELYDTKMKFASLPSLVTQMRNLTDIIEKRRSILARLNPEYEEKYVQPCINHADQLTKHVNDLGRLFNQTLNVADFPLQAAKSYATIVSAIEEAERAANEARRAADKIYQQIYPEGGESLLDEATNARIKSEKLLQQANDLMEKIIKLQDELTDKQKIFEQLERLLNDTQRKLQYIGDALDSLPKDSTKNANRVLDQLKELISQLERTHSRVDDLSERIVDFGPQLEQLSPDTSIGLDDLRREFDDSMRTIHSEKESLVKVENKLAQVERLRDDLDLNLRELKAKILLARQKAASIRVSLGADRESTCIRTYEPDIEPSFTNNIVLYYSIKQQQQKDSLLLYLGARDAKDFMAIEMKDRHIRFIWNTGASERVIKHPMLIQTNDAQLSKDAYWYRIEAKRYGSHTNLTVQKVPDANSPDPLEVSDSISFGDIRNKQMDLDRNSYFYIGGLPPDLSMPPRQILTRSFAGCLYEVFLNEHRVGLWNFTSNIGCHGCKEGATEASDPTKYRFVDEFSYGRTLQVPDYSKNAYQVSFQFRTFDEEALLYFTSNPNTNDYVTIYLRDGRVFFECNFGAKSGYNSYQMKIVAEDQRVNTGSWITLSAERENDIMILRLNGREYEKKSTNQIYTKGLDLVSSNVFFGGVTPNFTIDWPDIPFRSFVGCISEPQIDTHSINLLRIQSFGIEAGCVDRPIRVASFNGEGYLELDGQPLLEEKMELSFTFKTNKKNGILMLSTFEGKTRLKEEHYYFFYITNGNLNVRLNGGGGAETAYTFSDINVSDGKYHTVKCIKENRKFRILLDDEHESQFLRLAKSRVIEAPEKGGLFIGGLPPGFTAVNKGHSSNFNGIIRDIVFDSKLIEFNSPVMFKSVRIGREGGTLDWLSDKSGVDVLGGTIQKTKEKSTSIHSTGKSGIYDDDGSDDDTNRMMSIPAESYGATECTQFKNAKTEFDSVRLGHSHNSNISNFVLLNTEEGEFGQDFSVSFSFRTFYPNGALFTLTKQQTNNQQQQQHYRRWAAYQNGHHTSLHHIRPMLTISLVDGRILLRMKVSHRNYVELAVKEAHKLNDGKWHHIEAGLQKQSLWLSVDYRYRDENHNPKRRLKMKSGVHAYLGGLPKELNTDSHLSSLDRLAYASNTLSSQQNFLPTYESLRGCVRNLHVNKQRINFHNLALSPEIVGRCYSEIEKGASFGGDNSFVVHSDEFNMAERVDISFEFKSTRNSGVLFALTNGSDFERPSLAIELSEDGSIIVSADYGSGSFSARKKLATVFDLCDGHWHSVKVHFSPDSITLKVDRSEAIYALPTHKITRVERQIFTSAPLYIGGVPIFAPSGVLTQRSFFRGCMRNVEVNDARKDWLSMQLFNVEPNSCPL